MDLHLVNLGSTPAGTHVSHWWCQEGHLAKIAPVSQKSPTYLGRHVHPLNKGVTDVNFGRKYMLILNLILAFILFCSLSVIRALFRQVIVIVP